MRRLKTTHRILSGAAIFGAFVLLGVGCPQYAPVTPEPTADTSIVTTETPTPVTVVSPSATPTAAATTGQATTTTEVTITAKAFVPASLTVTPGATVIFRNTDTAPHWVASDPHPVHTGLPGFDAGAAIAANGTYTFTFTTPGTFGFHDHLHPNLRGQIVVR